MPDPVLKTAQELTARPSLAATDILVTAPGTAGVAGKTTVGQLAASADFVDAVAEALNVWQEFPLGIDGATEVQIDPTVDRGSIEIDWGDGSSETVASGENAIHTYAEAFTGSAKLRVRPHASVTELILGGDNWALSLSDLPRTLTTLFRVGGISSVVSGDLAQAPANLKILHLFSTASVITGDLAQAPANLEVLHVYNTQSVITGDLAQAPANLTGLITHSTASMIVGDLAQAPANLDTLYASGQSVITGDLAQAPANLALLYLHGSQSTVTMESATGLAALNVRLDLSPIASALTATEVNRILVAIDANGLTPISGNLIDLGGTHAAPDATSGGLDGLAAKASLQARGWTVTTN